MGLSVGHLLIILAIILIIWGPSRLGGVGRGIGEAVRGFKKGLHGDDEIDITDSVKKREQLNQSQDHAPADDIAQRQKEKDKTRGPS